MTASCAADAPQNDLKLMKILKKYREINISISKATSEKLLNHMWYLFREVCWSGVLRQEGSYHNQTFNA